MEKKKEKTKPQIIIIMVGSLNSGKTELLYYLSKTMEHSSTIGIDSTTIKFDIDNKEINVNIITTAGQEKMQQLPSSYFRNNNGILLIFNVTDHSSFELIANFYDQIKKQELIQVMIVGNRSESNEKQICIEEKEIKELIGSYDGLYYEINNTKDENVLLLYLKEFIRRMLKKKEKKETVY